MKIIKHNGYEFPVNERGNVAQVFIWDRNHPRRSAFHLVDNKGVTVACVVLKRQDVGVYNAVPDVEDNELDRFNSSLQVAFEVYKGMFP